MFIDITGNICSHPPAFDKGGDQVTNKLHLASFELDLSAELLIFSAYLRLLETYHRVLESIQTAMKQGHLEHSTAATTQPPTLVIGSFSPKQWQQKLESLSRRRHPPRPPLDIRGGFQSAGGVSLVIVPDLSLKAIHAREHALIRMTDDLESSLL
ncbi:hypothetical protein F5Y07DRAFT_246970 [Xylaria sp. FL0933]|nr:hypothetical protein F5Y07DRAFT_246970 [Xylaria sp. FL0933]